ncbi:MAG: TatD family hydrolase [Proteobacteria bacterium]|nr:TatD family hydrolase [Pseudomonadota bacterium]
MVVSSLSVSTNARTRERLSPVSNAPCEPLRNRKHEWHSLAITPAELRDLPDLNKPDLIDSHSHLDAAEFDPDRAAVLARARAAGVRRQIVPAVAFDTFPALRDLCAREIGLYPAYGLHPIFLDEHVPQHLDALPDWIARENPVAIGECGLDFFVPGLDVETQRFYFRRQLEIARDFSLPVILHARRALDEVIATIRQIGQLRGVVHSFSGSLEQARQLWKCGFQIGIGGPVTYPRARRLREIVATMPIEFLLLETDAPDQPLQGHQGARNEPALLAQVCACVAELRGAEPREIAAATTRNCTRLFQLPAEGAQP